MARMKNKKDLKIGILFGIVGFILTLLSGYLATGTFDLIFPVVIGIGFFGGGFLGSLLRRLQQTGEQKKVNLIMFVIICLLLISQISRLVKGEGMGSMWRITLTGSTIIGCVFVGYVIISSLIKKDRDKKDKE